MDREGLSMNNLISRQAAIDKINERQRKLIYRFGFENDAVKIMDIAKIIVISTPPAQPDIIEMEADELCSRAERRTDDEC